MGAAGSAEVMQEKWKTSIRVDSEQRLEQL